MNDWQIEQGSEPLFPDVLWSRPENKAQAGTFLVIGGNAHGFHSVFQAFNTLSQLGVGEIRVVLPESLKKHTKNFFPEATYLDATPGGSFSKKSFEQLLQLVESSDGIILPGNIENNSETTLLFEQLFASTELPIAVSSEAMASLGSCWMELLKRPQTILHTDLSGLQKLAKTAQSATAVTSTYGKQQLVDFLHTFTQDCESAFMVEFEDLVVVSEDGHVCVCQANETQQHDRATKAGVFATQLHDTFFEAIVSSVV